MPEDPQRKAPVILIILLVVAVVAGGAAWFLAADDDPPETKPSGAAKRQRTLLIQVAGDDRKALVSALFGVDPSGRRAAAVLIPSGLLVDVRGEGSADAEATTFGERLLDAHPGASIETLSELLGLRVDGSWVLTEAGLAALVDRVGGVQVDVDVDVVTTGADGERTLVVQAGPHKLRGAAAAAYATYLDKGEPELARLARFDEVMTEVLRRLPTRRSELAVALAALKAEARSTLPVRELEDTLLALRRAATTERLFADVLPVNDVPIAGQDTAFELDVARTQQLLKLRFSESLRKP